MQDPKPRSLLSSPTYSKVRAETQSLSPMHGDGFGVSCAWMEHSTKVGVNEWLSAI